MEQREFPNYTQITPLLPQWFWHGLRLVTLLLTFFVIYTLFTRPDLGLTLFWKLMIPLLPLSFAVVPGLWRNVCPMAFLNQLPRMTGKGLERTLSQGMRKLALMVSIVAFIIFVTSRAPLLNHSGTAVGIMLVSVLLLALIGGLVFKGRSGWCGTFCPLAPLQKVYGHAPLLMVRNGYCEPCLGCQKNCYDFNPRAAIFSDLDDADAWWSDKRKYFAAMLPGLIIGFFNASVPAETGLSAYYLSILTPPLIAVGLYVTLQNTFHLGDYRQVALFGLVALGIFYWYGTPVVASGIEQVFGLTLPPPAILAIRSAAVLVCVAVIVRGLLSERAYAQAQQASSRGSVGGGVRALKAAIRDNENNVQVRELASGKQFEVRPAQNLLDALEAAELPIMSGCRMGMCGSDPVVITEGSDNLEPPDENELTTLRRLGLEGKARLACCCRPKGEITIDLDANPDDIKIGDLTAMTEHETVDDGRFHVIIIGNGIAGISTAEHLRELDDSADGNCRITLISQEPHHFYNRMGLEKVVHGRAAMQGLYLMQEDWYQRNDIDVWLNTRVVTLNRQDRQIELGTGEWLSYDKLVLATGGRAFVPPTPGADLPGCFTLRDAADALSIRAWSQTRHCKQAVVLGGGVLGVEAADALHQLGMRVTIVHNSYQLMNRQLDLHAGVILRQFLANSGIDVITGAGIQRIDGVERLQRVILTNGEALNADLLLFCIGIRADVALAEAAGLEINRGVRVDTHMRTSDEDIYCVGDAAELPGAISGLWSVGNEQGKVAGASVLGKMKQYEIAAAPPVQLKVSGIDLKCFGQIEDGEGIQSYSGGDVAQHKWKHLSVKDGHVIGGVFVNTPLAANAAISASKQADRTLSKEDINELMSKDGVS
jgi:nitrite reductase (NADH) large subunit